MRTAPPNAKPLITWPAVLAIIAACGLSLYWVFPDDIGFVERLARDHKNKEAWAALQKVSRQERARNPALCDLLDLRLGRSVLKPGDERAALAFVDRLLQLGKKHHWSPEFTGELRETLATVATPSALSAHLKPANLTGEQKAIACQALTQRALAENTPRVAAQIFSDLTNWKTAKEDNTVRLVELWRMAGEPRNALNAITSFQPDPDKLFAGHSHLFDVEIQLLREIGDNAAAFQLLRRQFRVAQQPEEIARSLQLLTETAEAAGLQKQILPEYEHALKAMPENIPLVMRYGKLLMSAGDSFRASQVYARLVEKKQNSPLLSLKYAQACEWSGQQQKAFDAYLKLSRDGNQYAVERIVALAPGLFRIPEMVDALQRAVPVPDHPEFRLTLARNLVHLGKYSDAEAQFAHWLASHPDDYSVWIELGVLQKALSQFESAQTSFKAAESLRPGDLASSLALAELASARGFYDEALNRYNRIALVEANDKALQRALCLADSLGSLPTLVTSFKEWIASKAENVSGFHYTGLAMAYHRLGRQQDELLALQAGLKRFPEDDALRLNTAEALGNLAEFQEAAMVLARHPKLRSEKGIALLQLKLLIGSDDYKAAKKFAESLPQEFVLQDPEIKRCVAASFEAAGDLAGAEKLYRELLEFAPDIPEAQVDFARVNIKLRKYGDAEKALAPAMAMHRIEALPLEAEIYLAKGDAKRAAELQEIYSAQIKSRVSPEGPALAQILSISSFRTASRPSSR